MMSITMRLIQEFDPAKEKEFMELEKKFAELEAARPDYPKGTRMQPISSTEPCNCLIWQCKFNDMNAANEVLDFFQGDSSHEALLEKQLPFFKRMKIEFYRDLEF